MSTMRSWSQLSWGCVLLSTLITPSLSAVITARPSNAASPAQLETCRAVVSAFDYSAKSRRDHELPVCSAHSHVHARDGKEVVPASSEVGVSLVGQTELSSLFGRQVVGGDDYTCGPDRPCKNGACCPKKTGQCNYGEEACGTSGISPNDVCWSNCDAKAECGKNAKVPGQKCPLNVCCGKWGFCGMTKDFCEKEDHGATGGCQSNCNQPGPKNKASDQLNRVIGYYEAWRHDSKCQDMGLNDIPVNSLTHLYFSFAFITPNEYNIIGMDGLPDKLFTDFTDLKTKNPGLKTIIAIGGWTHNDPGPLQKVFSNMVSTKETRSRFIQNLLSFLRKNAFDGVDFDWEYPGADDRGGVPEDGVNFTKFLKELDDENKKQPQKYIVSFTAPTSFWYLRHFDLKAIDHVDFVNVMSYDLHGVWDRDNPIGSYIYAHTNLTEQSLAFDLFWRNDVPANKLNMGLGFYGRAFQLADPSCNKPGCLFKGGATKGACSGESGILSYREIMEIIKENKIKPVHDKEAGVKYITYGTDQWVSYDDKETFKQKKDLASKLGLGGYLIWAIDQDDAEMSALSAVLDPKPLGDFKSIDKGDENWTGTNEMCYISACGDGCKAGEIKITDQKCDGKKKSTLCCPLSGAPDPKSCHWRGGETKFCNGHCQDDEVMTHMSKYGDGADCWDGQLAHCCKSAIGEKNICKWRGVGEQCHSGELPLTFSGTVLDILEDVAKIILRVVGRAYPLTALTGEILLKVLDELDLDTKKLYCCPEEEVSKWKNCAWYGKPGNCFDGHCPDMKTVQITDSYFGGGETCGWHDRVRTFCCESSDDESLFLPVPLKDLFEHPPDGGIDTDFTLETDKTSDGGDDDPNDAAFQFVVLVSPEELQVSLDKRDGSNWDVFDCNDSVSEGEHTVRMVCNDFTPGSNCHKIGLGHGVPGTILQMPKGCGPGKYAVAKSMTPAAGKEHSKLLPRHLSHLASLDPVVYDLTFDYDFARVPRDLGDTQMRIDYSNQDEYWDNIVAGSVSRKRDLVAKRTLADVGGSHVRWLEEEFRDDFHINKINKRDLHERWFGKSILEWLAALVKPEIKREFSHKYEDTVTAKLVDEEWDCTKGNIGYQGHILAQALLNVKVESSFGFTLIVEKLSLPLDLSKSYLTFYNKGEVTGVITLEAVARAKYNNHKVIADIPFPGASFKIPGIATIGPQLVVEGSIDAQLAVAGTVETRLQIAKWNVRQVVPDNSGYKPALIDNSHTDLDRTGDFEGIKKPEFYAGVAVSGDIEIKLSAAAEFGVRFVEQWEVPAAAAAVVGEATVTAGLTGGVSTSGTCPFTYELAVGARLFARVTAPDLFGIGWSGGEVTLTEARKDIFKKGTCPSLGPIPTKRGVGLIDGGSISGNDSAVPAAYEGHLLPAIWDGPGLVSSDIAPVKSFSRRGGVYGPKLTLGVGNRFCPPPANGESEDDGPISCTDLMKEDQDKRKRSENLHQHLESHRHAHGHSHGSRNSHGHHHPHGRPNETNLVERLAEKNGDLVHLDERNIDYKDVHICSMSTRFRYPTDSSIPNANVYGWQEPKNCNSFRWQNPLPARVSGTQYHSEHILEAQMIKDFFDYIKEQRGNDFPNPVQGGTGNVDFCTYVNALFDQTMVTGMDSARGPNANILPIDHITAQYPTNLWRTEEYVSLQASLNSPMKNNAWADQRVVDTDGWLRPANSYYIYKASGARKAFQKLRDAIGLRNYLNEIEVYTILRDQKNRVGAILDKLDTTTLPANPPPGHNAWQPMGLKTEWDNFMRYRFITVQARTMEPINNFYRLMKEFWTTDAKKAEYAPVDGDNKKLKKDKEDTLQLIEDIETLEVIVNRLGAWVTPF